MTRISGGEAEHDGADPAEQCPVSGGHGDQADGGADDGQGHRGDLEVDGVADGDRRPARPRRTRVRSGWRHDGSRARRARRPGRRTPPGPACVPRCRRSITRPQATSAQPPASAASAAASPAETWRPPLAQSAGRGQAQEQCGGHEGKQQVVARGGVQRHDGEVRRGAAADRAAARVSSRDHQAAPPAIAVARPAARTAAHNGGSSSSTSTSPPRATTAGASVPTTWVASRRSRPGTCRSRLAAAATRVSATTTAVHGAVAASVVGAEELLRRRAVEFRSTSDGPGAARRATGPAGSAPSAVSTAAPCAQTRGANAVTSPSATRVAHATSRSRVSRAERVRPVGQQHQRDEGQAGRRRTAARPGRRGGAPRPRRTAPRPGAATRGSRPTTRRARPSPARGPSPARAAPARRRRPARPCRTPPHGTSPRSSTNAPASTGIAIVVPTAGFSAAQALVEQSTSATDHGDHLDAVQPADGLASRPHADPDAHASRAPPTSAAGAAPATGRPDRRDRPTRRPARSTVSMPGHHQPERLGRSTQALRVSTTATAASSAGEAEQHQRAAGQPQHAPGDRDEDDRRDQQAQRAQREQHHRARMRTAAGAAASAGRRLAPRSGRVAGKLGRAGCQRGAAGGATGPGPRPAHGLRRGARRSRSMSPSAATMASHSCAPAGPGPAGRTPCRWPTGQACRGSRGRWWCRRVCSCPDRPAASRCRRVRLATQLRLSTPTQIGPTRAGSAVRPAPGGHRCRRRRRR